MGRNETTVLKRVYDRASGGTTWMIRTGRVVTLAELFYFGMWMAPCWDVYRFWLGLPVYAHKRQHSTSGSTHGRLRQKAKEMRYADTGSYALPW